MEKGGLKCYPDACGSCVLVDEDALVVMWPEDDDKDWSVVYLEPFWFCLELGLRVGVENPCRKGQVVKTAFSRQ